MTINFPFSRLGIAMGDPIYIPPDARAEEFPRYQKQVEAAINDVTARGYVLADADMARGDPSPASASPWSKVQLL